MTDLPGFKNLAGLSLIIDEYPAPQRVPLYSAAMPNLRVKQIDWPRRLTLLALALLLAACTTGQAAPTLLPTALPSATAFASATALPSTTPTRPRPQTPTPSPAPTRAQTHTPTTVPSATPVLTVERGSLAPGFSLTVYAEVPAPTSLASRARFRGAGS